MNDGRITDGVFKWRLGRAAVFEAAAAAWLRQWFPEAVAHKVVMRPTREQAAEYADYGDVILDESNTFVEVKSMYGRGGWHQSNDITEISVTDQPTLDRYDRKNRWPEFWVIYNREGTAWFVVQHVDLLRSGTCRTTYDTFGYQRDRVVWFFPTKRALWFDDPSHRVTVPLHFQTMPEGL